MKKALLIALVIMGLYSVNAYAEDAEIAVEWRLHNRVLGVGKLEVGFFRDEVDFMNMYLVVVGATFEAYKFKILEKKIDREGNYRIISKMTIGGGALEFVYSGYIDLTKPSTPRIELESDSGHVIRNITNEGIGFKERYLPGVSIGR